MENPSSWGPAEKTVAAAIDEWNKARAKGVIGLSLISSITEALRKAGLLSKGA